MNKWGYLHSAKVNVSFTDAEKYTFKRHPLTILSDHIICQCAYPAQVQRTDRNHELLCYSKFSKLGQEAKRDKEGSDDSYQRVET